ncbi:hypothetical protein FVEG_15722 [Fusarium verticillioides 7600]|uniref:Uncharacterized protein n=1 Tax=Gibberella moniliformis (strain M3125 / FGSC 7600) TaxID=334819 RepID=W7LZP0_GIBM7|nr:hypothetical protein FVEG_15722 [Fusarium verticillioides 7600]EWG44778.1 hypothetical protein FVEG_15722 [Fusarium verticillioides 7600]
MNLDTQLTALLVGIRACLLCSNDGRIIQNALLALEGISLLLEAEQRVYAPSTRTQTPENNCLSSEQSDGSPQGPVDTMKEQFAFGNIALDDNESTLIARRLIRDAAIRVGQNLRWIGMKLKSGITGSIHHPQRLDQERELAMGRVKIIVARTSLHFS